MNSLKTGSFGIERRPGIWFSEKSPHQSMWGFPDELSKSALNHCLKMQGRLFNPGMKNFPTLVQPEIRNLKIINHKWRLKSKWKLNPEWKRNPNQNQNPNRN